MSSSVDTGPVVQTNGPPDGGLYDPDMARERLVGAQEARDNFRQIVDAVESGEEYAVVLRRSKAVVAVVPVHWLRRMIELGIPDESAPTA
jgi:hypothetical protein